MRWDDLFDDLQSQAAELQRLELEGEVEDRIRAEVGQIRLVDRLRAATGGSVTLRCDGGTLVTGRLDRVGPDWLLVAEDTTREAAVCLASVASVSGLGRLSMTPDSVTAVEARLGLRYLFRGIARDRSAVRIHLTDGHVLDATIDRVGADFIEVAEHAPGELRRRDEVRRVSAVAMAAIAVVRREV